MWNLKIYQDPPNQEQGDLALLNMKIKAYEKFQ